MHLKSWSEKEPIMRMINQVFPAKKQVPLERLYLGQRLMEIAVELGRGVVFTDFLTDKNGVVAKATQGAHFEIPAELKNSSDWALYQELMAQADVIISSGSYFECVSRLKLIKDILGRL